MEFIRCSNTAAITRGWTQNQRQAQTATITAKDAQYGIQSRLVSGGADERACERRRSICIHMVRRGNPIRRERLRHVLMDLRTVRVQDGVLVRAQEPGQAIQRDATLSIQLRSSESCQLLIRLLTLHLNKEPLPFDLLHEVDICSRVQLHSSLVLNLRIFQQCFHQHHSLTNCPELLEVHERHGPICSALHCRYVLEELWPARCLICLCAKHAWSLSGQHLDKQMSAMSAIEPSHIAFRSSLVAHFSTHLLVFATGIGYRTPALLNARIVSPG
mmetsp:Transcript_147844/g.257775  ORF Transcript_147844/g.257775 Transcript_147844/m.257775 type:complete len:273 (-) Transcript_147844:882-1700(-)